MTAPIEAGLIAALVVLFAGFAAAIVARVINDRRPLPDGPVVRDPELTGGIPLHWAQEAAAEGERRRQRAAADAQWVGVR